MKMEHLHPFPLEPCPSAPVFSSPYWKTEKTFQGTVWGQTSNPWNR